MGRLKIESNRGADGLSAGDEPVFVFDGRIKAGRAKQHHARHKAPHKALCYFVVSCLLRIKIHLIFPRWLKYNQGQSHFAPILTGPRMRFHLV